MLALASEFFIELPPCSPALLFELLLLLLLAHLRIVALYKQCGDANPAFRQLQYSLDTRDIGATPVGKEQHHANDKLP